MSNPLSREARDVVALKIAQQQMHTLASINPPTPAPNTLAMADAILDALSTDGWEVVRLELAGAVAPDGSGFRSRVDNWTPEDWKRVYTRANPTTGEGTE